MKVSELWLRSFIDPKESISVLADQLTNAGIEVDNLQWHEAKGKSPQAILTLKVPPNRGDCLSMEGVARELSLLTDIPYKPIAISQLPTQMKESFVIRLESPELCPRYRGCIIQKVNSQTKSPDWLIERLELADLRSVSVIVDILNYVMLELGQPLHAFDLAKLDSEIIVRKSKQGEKLKLLDGQTIELDSETLIIADKTKPQALAGVMGGEASSVTEKTTDLFLESAYFDPIAIRKAAKRYGLRTDSSFRFERGVDPEMQGHALFRAQQLIVEITSGIPAGSFEEKDIQTLPMNPSVLLRKERVSQVLGLSLSSDEIVKILQRSHMKIESIKEGFKVYPPSFRQDIHLEVDLIEEIARIYGFNKLSTSKLPGQLGSYAMPETLVSASHLKEVLINRGFSEVITYSFIDPKLSNVFFPGNHPLLLKNPISAELAAMRVSLLPGLVQALQYNQRRQLLRSRFFELGLCFLEEKSKITEKQILAAVCSGSVYAEQWGESSRSIDFYDIKKELEALLSLAKGQTFIFEKAEHPALHPGQTANIIRQSEKSESPQLVGIIGALHPRILRELELEGPIFVFELDLAKIGDAKKPEFHALSKFPAIRRDIAILVDNKVFAEDLRSAIVKCVGELLQGISLFDVYQGKGIEPGKKSVALGLILQHPSRTLVESEVNDLMKQVVLMLSKQFHAILRE